MRDYPMESSAKSPGIGMALTGANGPGVINPTLRENIDAKIKWHQEEIRRLEKIKETMPFMLDVNLRDLREAMNF